MKLALALFTIAIATALFAVFGKPDSDENHPAWRRRRDFDHTSDGSE